MGIPAAARGPKGPVSRYPKDKPVLIRGKEEGRAVLEEGTARAPKSWGGSLSGLFEEERGGPCGWSRGRERQDGGEGRRVMGPNHVGFCGPHRVSSSHNEVLRVREEK